MHMLPAYVGIILKKEQKVFLVKRQDTDWASGLWNFPGGLVEQGETLAHAASREIAEEAGVTVPEDALKLVHVLDIKAGGSNTRDIIGFYFLAEEWEGTATNNEPHRHSKAEWFSLDDLPQDITEHAQHGLKGVRDDIRYSTHGW